ncbi:hypothetical protein BS47DRAFT_1331597 [Hydnum rufescens UP504]|uniref:Cupredoxin n=1 Tax=Hydnum rufescens UP504 TaxID=1448309 RepID=A0A9P6DTM0_9AGAM|nr:hypothetical protein BS47DRAFT_1331597 [Hydnum rufescens UP504]
MIFSYIIAGLALVGASRAATVNITVGANNSISFDPPSVNASVGDTILFTFMSGNHSVISSSFMYPCFPSGNISSPFFPVTARSTRAYTFRFVVNSTAPIWLHCAQLGHCQSGMVAAVNAPTTGNTFSLYQQIAEGKASAPSPSSSGYPDTYGPPSSEAPNPYGPPSSQALYGLTSPHPSGSGPLLQPQLNRAGPHSPEISRASLRL